MCHPSDQTTFSPLQVQVVVQTPVAVVAGPPVPSPPVPLPPSPRPASTAGGAKMHSVAQRRNRPLSRRDLLLLVHVLIKCLEESQSYKLKLQAKALVSECIKRNRMGDPHFSPLQESLETRLRGLVGPVYWKRAQDCLRSYQRSNSHKEQTCPAAASLSPVAI